MIASAASSLLIPLALTAGLGSQPSAPSLHHEVRAYVTGYNTVAGQTDSTPCVAASGANICGRHDAVACPRHIDLGTVVEINGSTYICEDRLAKKFDSRFDISCDKDTKCPPQVTGWATIKVYDADRPQAAASDKAATANPGQHAAAQHAAVQHAAAPVRIARYAPAKTFAALHPKLAAAAAKVFPPRPQLAVATANFISRTSTRLVASVGRPVAVLRGHTHT